MKNDPIRSIGLLTHCLAVLVFFATGCDRNALLKLSGYSRESFVQVNAPQRQESFAKQSAELLRQGRYDELVHSLQPAAVGANTHQTLIAMHDILAERGPTSIKVIEAKKLNDDDANTSRIVLDYEYPSAAKAVSGSTDVMPARWVFVTLKIRSRNAAPDLIDSIDVVPSERPIEEINAFTFEDKGFSQYMAFAIGILLTAFTFYAAVVCIRSKIGRQKWLWVIFMLFTVCLASVNWTSGQWSFNTISFKLGVPPIPADLVVNSAYGPWNLTLGLPIGAIAFMLYRRFRIENGTKSTNVEKANTERLAL